MDYCETCVYYPPSSCDGKPCTQCDPESLLNNCYVNKEDYITKKRMDERLAMMHKLYPNAKPTNADRIRSMTDEELATWLNCMQSNAYHCGEFGRTNAAYPFDNKAWLEWLKEESEGE